MRPRGWWLDLVLLAGFAVLTVALADWAVANPPAPFYWVLRVRNYLGQGGQVLMPIAVILAALVAWRRQSIRPLLVFAAVFVLTYVTIGPLKIGRASWRERV